MFNLSMREHGNYQRDYTDAGPDNYFRLTTITLN